MQTLHKLMTAKLKTIRADETVEEAARRMRDEKVGSLLVEQGSRIVAVVTETDIVRKAVAKGADLWLGADLRKEKLEKIMSSPIAAIDVHRSPQDAHDLMADRGIRHLAVTDNEKIVGMLSVRDLLVHFKSAAEPRGTKGA